MFLNPILLLAFGAMWIVGCKPPTGNNSATKAQCSGFGADFADCVEGQAEDGGFLGSAPEMGKKARQRELGPVMAIKYAGDFKNCSYGMGGDAVKDGVCDAPTLCLGVEKGRVTWQSCQNFKKEQQFHFIQQVPIMVSVHKGIVHKERAFLIATRASIEDWFSERTAAKRGVAKPIYQCLVPEEKGIRLGDCEKASYFMALVNRFDDDGDEARKTKNQYVSIVSLMGFSAAIERTRQSAVSEAEKEDIFETLGMSDKEKGKFDYLKSIQQDQHGKSAMIPLLENLKDCGKVKILEKTGDNRAVGACPQVDVRADQNDRPTTRVFLHPCDNPGLTQAGGNCGGLEPIKSFGQFVENVDYGPVIKVKSKSDANSCLQVDGRKLRVAESCDKNASDNPNIQFRMEVVPDQMTNGTDFVRLRWKKDRHLCADLARNQVIECEKVMPILLDGPANNMYVNYDGQKRYFSASECVSAASHKKPGRFDCQKDLHWRWAFLDKFSIGISFIPFIGTAAAIAIDSVMCAGDEPEYAQRGCLSLILDAGLGLAFGDIVPLSGFAKTARVARVLPAPSLKETIAGAGRMAFTMLALRSQVGMTRLAYDLLQVDVVRVMMTKKMSPTELSAYLAQAFRSTGPVTGYPRPGAETKVFLKDLKAKVKTSKMSQDQKKRVLDALNPLLN